MKSRSTLVLTVIGLVFAFGLSIFFGVLMCWVDEPVYMTNPTELMPSELSNFSSLEQEGSVNSENTFFRSISGSFMLVDPDKYEKIEVLAALYDNRGNLLTEYAASKENIERENASVTFTIAVYEPHGMFDVAGYEYTVQGE